MVSLPSASPAAVIGRIAAAMSLTFLAAAESAPPIQCEVDTFDIARNAVVLRGATRFTCRLPAIDGTSDEMERVRFMYAPVPGLEELSQEAPPQARRMLVLVVSAVEHASSALPVMAMMKRERIGKADGIRFGIPPEFAMPDRGELVLRYLSDGREMWRSAPIRFMREP